MDSKKFVEIKKPVEEIRYLDNQEQEAKKTKVLEKLEETVLPTAHASSDEDKRIEEGLKKEYGVVNSLSGGTTAIPCKILGKAEQSIGDLTDKESFKAAGRVHDEGANKPAE